MCKNLDIHSFEVQLIHELGHDDHRYRQVCTDSAAQLFDAGFFIEVNHCWLSSFVESTYSAAVYPNIIRFSLEYRYINIEFGRKIAKNCRYLFNCNV